MGLEDDKKHLETTEQNFLNTDTESEIWDNFLFNRFKPDSTEKTWQKMEAWEYNLEKIKNTGPENLAIINREGLNYVWRIKSPENEESEVEFVDKDKYLWFWSVKTVKGIKSKDVYEHIKKEGWDYEEWDMVFARIIEVDDEWYTLYLWEQIIKNEKWEHEKKDIYVRYKKEDIEETTNKELEKLND